MQGRRRDGFGKCGSGLEDVKEENYTVADRLPLSTPFFPLFSLFVGREKGYTVMFYNVQFFRLRGKNVTRSNLNLVVREL